MDKDTADQVVRFIMELCKRRNKRTVWINFHGGEPLLNKQVIMYILQLLKEVRDPLKIYTSMTTNCSIFDNEICYGINELTVSIDGTKLSHDKNRKHKDGTGTYEKSINNALLYLKEKKEIRLRMVVTANNVNRLFENVIHLYKFRL